MQIAHRDLSSYCCFMRHYFPSVFIKMDTCKVSQRNVFSRLNMKSDVNTINKSGNWKNHLSETETSILPGTLGNVVGLINIKKK